MNLSFITGFQIERLIGYGALAVLVMILIFLLIRQIVCWYWKINERTKLLYDIRGLLMRLVEVNEERNGSFFEEELEDKKNENYHQK